MAPRAKPDPATLRVDSFISMLTSVMQNGASGAGSASDPASSWYVQPTALMSSTQHGWLWTKNGIAASIAQIPALELAQAGLSLTTGETDPDCSKLDEDFGLTTALGECMMWARVFGGGGVLVDVEGDDWGAPWVPAQGQQVRLRVSYSPLLRPLRTALMGWTRPVVPDIWRDCTPPWGIEYYELVAGSWSPGIRGPIHWTRVLPMIGHAIPDGIGIPTISGWPGISIFDHIWAQLAGDESLAGAARRVSDRLAIWVMTLQTMASKQTGPEAAGLQAMLDANSERFKTSGLMTIGQGETLEAVGLPLDGFDKLDDVNKTRLIAVSRIPEFKVWGTSATGFGDDDGARENWRNTLRGWWDHGWRANVRRAVLGLSVVEFGRAPVGLRVEPGGWLTKVSIEDERTIGQVETVVAALVDGGILTREEGRKKLAAEGWDLIEAEVGAVADPVAPVVDADPIDTPDEIPDDTSAAVFAEQMTAHGFAKCEHGKANRCRLCGIERVRDVQVGPDGEPMYGVKWRAIGAVQTDAHEGTAYLWLPVPEQERTAAVQRAVADLVPLEGYEPGDPMPSLYHVTALYLGPTSQARYRDVQARAPLAAGPPITLHPKRVMAFPAGPDGRSPIVIEIDGAEVGALHDRLRSVLAPLPPDEHHPFVAHLTLGFAVLPPDLDLGAIPVPADLGEAAELRLTFDGRDTVWPL